MRKILLRIFIILSILYGLFCGGFYLFQEKLVFYPQKLDENYQFSFDQRYEELNIKTQDGLFLNSFLFKADSTKGVIIFLHGNAGALDTWGQLAPFYVEQNYDILFFDYRGFGKSDGKIENQSQLFRDVQTVYDTIKAKYSEDRITIMGYSIGTGPAAYLASKNNPQKLILIAPYYSLTNVVKSICPIIPEFLIKYKLETYKYIPDCSMPVTIFHGNEDQVIDYRNSEMLSNLLSTKDNFILIDNVGHNDILENEMYKREMMRFLAK